MDWKFGLRAKIIVFFSIAAIIAMVAGSFISHYFLKEEITKLKKQDLVLISEGYGEEINQIFNFTKQLTETIAEKEKVKNYLLADQKNEQQEEILNILENYLIGDNYSAVYLMDQDGNTLVSTNDYFVGNNYNFRHYFKKALQDGYGYEMATGVTSGEPGYYFSHIVKDLEERVVGVVVIKMNPSLVDQALKNHSDLAQHFEVMLVDEYGIVVYSPIQENLYNSLRYMTPEEKIEAGVKERFPEDEIQSLDYREVYSFSQLNEPAIVETSRNNKDNERIISFYPLKEFGYSIIVESSFDDIDKTANQISWWRIINVIGSIAMVSVVFIYFVNKILKPLSNLSETIQKVRDGDYTQRAQVQAMDEVGQLADSFNNMINEIDKTKKNVEKKVQEKTADLEELNRKMTNRELKMIDLKKKIKELEKNENKK